MMPLISLIHEHRELGLLVAVVLGFCFGFVLERAGFGQAPKLAAQFYLRDLRVFKVMFSAIVTAMLGVMVASGVGLVDLTSLSEGAVSFTYLWPMVVGGTLLGVGFIVSGYCPGTSVVAAASGNIDGMLTFGGVVIGSVAYAELLELVPSVAAFHVSSDQGHVFLYQLVGIPAPVLAGLVTVMAIALFFGADKLETIMARRARREAPTSSPRARRFALAGLASFAVVAIATLAVPVEPRASVTKSAQRISQPQLARRVVDEPWTVRLLDLRDEDKCRAKRIPGAECTPTAMLAKLGLAHASGHLDLVLVGERDLERPPKAALSYPGRVLILDGGFEGWRRFALRPPAQLGADASAAERESYRFRAALHTAMTGRRPAPPPAANKRYVPKPKKKKAGGCS